MKQERYHLREAPPSRATTAEQAWEEGERAYSLGQYDVAVAAFKRGWELEPKPQFLYNLAQAYRLGDDDDHALFFYRRFLNKGEPTGSVRQKVEGYIRELEARLPPRPNDYGPGQPD